MRQPSGDLVPLRRSSPPKVAKPATPSKIDGRITLPADPAGLSQLLNQLPAIVADLVATATPHELERARNKAESLRYAVKQAKLGIEAQQTAAEARILLDHRLGALLADG